MQKNKQASSQLKYGVVLSYLSLGINMIIQLVYTPVMIRLLGQSEYGVYTLVSSFVSYLSLFSFGFTGAYLRFYSRVRANNDERGLAKLNGLFLLAFAVMSLLALVSGGILSCFPRQIFGNKLSLEEITRTQILMRILVFNIAITFPSTLFESFISSREQFLFQRVVNLLSVIINPMICLPLLLCGRGSVVLVSITTAITVAKLIVNMCFCKSKLRISFDIHNPDLSLLKEISGFSFFIFINMIIDQINWSVDKYILGWVAGSSSVAVYSVGAQINSIFTSFSTAISSVFAPRINRIAQQNEEDRKLNFTRLFIKIGRIQFAVLGLILIGFITFGRFFITDIYAGNEYYNSYYVAIILMIPASVPLIQNIGIEIQRALNKHQFRSIIYFVMAIINLGISIPLAKKFGPVGCALGTAASLILANIIIMNIFYHKKLGINICLFWKNIIMMSKGLILPIILGIFIEYKKIYTGLIGYIITIIGFSFIYILSMWFLGLNEEEKKRIREWKHHK